jgi:hypothetical protein
MKKIYFLLLLLPANYLHAQNNQLPNEGVTITNAVPASPDAVALGKYGSIPVSYFTGIPNISIPLYTIKSGNLTLPMLLSYHSGGIKVEEAASSVGLGWALNAGGSITRTVRGLPDESQYGYLDAQNNNVYNIYNSLFTSTGSLSLASAGQLLNYYADGSRDGEADIFNFNFAGYSGQFEFRPNGTVMVSPQQNIIITCPYVIGNRITQFIVTTPDGVKYYFGSQSGTTAVETTNSHGKTSSMSWWLSSIVSPSSSEIDFTYKAESFSQTQPGGTMYRLLSGTGLDVNGHPLPQQQDNTYSTESSMSTMKLTSITFENGRVTVFSNTTRLDNAGSTMIDSININSTGFSKSYKLYHTNLATTRLRLDSLIGRLDPNYPNVSSKKEKYSFSYNPDPWSNGTAFQNAQDWWGYYNGYNQTTIVPWEYDPHQPSVKLTGAERAPVASVMTDGILTQIRYPTGGYTNFTFEANQEPDYDFDADTYQYDPHTTAISNDPPNIYYNYDTNNGNASNLIHIYNSGNTAPNMPLHVIAYGLGLGSNPSPPAYDYVEAFIYQKDAQGNYTIGAYTITNTDTTIFLPQGYYQIRLQDTKNQTNPQNYNYIKYYVNATWNNLIPIQGSHYHGHTAGGLRIAQIADYDGINSTLFNLRTYKYNLNDTTSSGYLNFQPKYSYNLNVLSGDYHNVVTSSYFVRTAVSNYPLATQQGAVVGYYHVEEDLDNNGQKGKTDYYYSINGEGVDGNGFPFAPPTTMDWHEGLLTDQVTSKYVGNGVYAKVQEKQNVYSSINTDSEISIKAGFNPFPFNYNGDISYYGSVDPQIAGTGGTLLAQPYLNQTDFMYLSSDTSWVYDGNDATKSVKTWDNYQFDPTTYLLNKVQTVNSKNELITQTVTYPYDYQTFSLAQPGSLKGVQRLSVLNIANYPIEEVTTKSNLDGSNLRTIKGILTTYKINKPYRDSIYELQTIAPLTNFVPSSTSISTITRDSHYQPVVSFDKYDAYGSIMQERRIGDVVHSYIWGYSSTYPPYNNTYPIAEVINADSASIAYTNFESYDTNGLGNWVYSNSYTTTNVNAPMGAACFALGSGATLTKGGLNSGSKYIVSFWANSGASVTVTGGTVTNIATGNAKSGWYYHEYNVTGTSSVTIGGAGLIDEARLYPLDAQMNTYTYIPLVGIASKCDTRNEITYYNFDPVGRLTQVQDQNRSIVKDYQYSYVNQGPIWQNVSGTQYCAKDQYGNYTGEQRVTQKDINQYSVTYQRTRDQSLGTQLAICLPTLVYANMKLTSSVTTIHGTSNTYEIDLYSDATYQTPYTTAANLTINYALVTTSDGSSQIYTVPYTIVVFTGANHVTFNYGYLGCGTSGLTGNCTESAQLLGGLGYNIPAF